jgi:hypothetical protein
MDDSTIAIEILECALTSLTANDYRMIAELGSREHLPVFLTSPTTWTSFSLLGLQRGELDVRLAPIMA